ncbi:MAG: hypothetical protein KDA45_05420, partial [Planctomycetales bacterium]|nr:hypothetical protein [Planctomycetales bacterium]
MWRQGTAWTRLIASALGILTLGVVSVLAIEGGDLSAKLAGAKKLLNDQNFSEAAQKFREVIRDEAASSEAVVESMRLLLQCQQQLRIESELDDDLRTAIAHHPQKFRVLDLAATQIEQATHYGTIADQQFTRGYGQGRGRFGRGAGGMGLGRVTGSGVNVLEQDRLQALRWRRQALQLAQQQGQLEHAAEIAEMQLALAETLQLGRSDRQAWNLQALTDISQEPNYLDLEGDNYLPARYAPVTETGEPVLYAVPDSWDAARSDGERLHWVLSQAQSADSLRWQARMRWADFLHSQFAVDTLQQDRWLFRSAPASDEPLGEDGVHAIHTLQTNETIARLASRVKRFSLSDEFNPLHIYQEVAQSSASGVNARAAWNLVQTFLNRRQYPQAAEQLEAYLSRFGDDNRQSRRKLLDNIRQPRLQFDPVPSQLAGRPATLSLLFRNAKTLSFTARKVDIEKILRDTKDYYRQASRGPQAAFGGQKNQSPPRLSVPTALFNTEGVDRYLLQQVAEWNTAVEPRPNHWDRRIEIETPLEAAGLYLIEADAQGGMHKTRCLVWIQDTVLVRKPLAGKWLLHAADAESGRPIADATIELFGFGPPPPSDAARPRLQTKNFAVRANSAGLAEVTLQDRFQWFCVARSRSGRLALLDFEHLWQSQRSDPTYGELKAYGVSDRPLYRPGEKVKAKFWLGYAVYGDQQAARLNNASLTVRLSDPQGIQVAERQLTTDEYGGCELEMDLSESAPLGRYHFQVVANAPASLLPGSRTRGNGSQGVATSLAIRVEEYRKPEFEVEILAPDRPVALGETVKARIQAKYYFGAPVTDAEVTVKVERSTYRDNYYPVAPYDWCYGPGYWWFAEDYVWYPGWKQWRGCLAPQPDWRPGWGMEPPELVLEQQLQLDSTGLATVEIDTALAKALYGQEDHQYTISVDVRDSSRRTLSAQGSVIAAQDAFKIYSWTDRGHYRVGDRIEAHFRARMLDDSPVVGRGTIDLLRITYDERLQPQEQVVASFPAQTDPQGQCVQELTADRGGQYRVRLRLQDAAEHTVEGAYIFTVRGPGMAGKDFRYAGLELTPDKKHYAPGESVQLQIAANRGDALVAVFVRPVDGAYPAPRWLQLENKSTVLEIPVGEADQPNFFVEAYTIYDGEFHSAVREIIVPPAERVLDVQIAADKREYLPGEAAELSLTVKDPSGKPVVGSCVVAVYDRSLEQIAGDSLPPDIREFFWKWQRHHQPRQSVSLQVWQQPITIEG